MEKINGGNRFVHRTLRAIISAYANLTSQGERVLLLMLTFINVTIIDGY